MVQLNLLQVYRLGKNAHPKLNGINGLQFIQSSWDNYVQFTQNGKIMKEIVLKAL
jgi:hypothetical protein